MKKLRSSKFFACKALESLFCFLDGANDVVNHEGEIKTIKSVVLRNDLGRVSRLRVDVCDNPVMIVSVDPITSHYKRKVTKVEVFSGFYYDGQGNPTDKTREVLNALLDGLSFRDILPEGVRVFIGQIEGDDKNICRLRHKDQYVILHEDYCNIISITPHADELIIQETDPSLSYQADEVRLYALQEH